MHILQIQWGIVVDNKFIIEVTKKAEKDKVWFQARGSFFSKLYSWFCDKIKERT